MLRDNKNETRRLTLAEHWSRLSVPKWAEKYRSNWRDLGLPSKLLMLTGVFVLLAEVLIFLPSVSTFRVDWLNERLTAAQLATLAAEGFPGGDVPSGLRAEMLRTAQVKAIASRRQGVRRLGAAGRSADDHRCALRSASGARDGMGEHRAAAGADRRRHRRVLRARQPHHPRARQHRRRPRRPRRDRHAGGAAEGGVAFLRA